MALQFCTEKLSQLTRLLGYYRPFMLTLCILNLCFVLVAVLGNLLVIRALRKASSMPATVKKLFLSLAFSDLAVGMLVQPIHGIIIAVMLNMASTGNHNFGSLCPTILSVSNGLTDILVSCASFLNVAAIAVDRLLAISLHLRYQELVTSKRVIVALVSVWITSGVAALISTLLTQANFAALVDVIVQSIGLLLTTTAYIRIYQVVRYHQNQIQSQLQLQNAQEMDLLRQKKSAYNCLFVYVVYLACYLPVFTCMILLLTNSLRISLMAVTEASGLLVFLNSSLNPFIYCWRYQEIREIVKSTVKKIFHVGENGT